MTKRFIKYIPSERSSWLRSKHPFAFLLLNLIAERVRCTPGDPSGLLVGECFIGDHDSIGATRGQYRHALKVLESIATIKKVETCRNRKKTTTGTTTVGTKVKLLNSDIWELNYLDNDHPNDHPTTTEQPPNNHEQERKKDKKEKKEQHPPAPQKIQFLDFVFLTQAEHDLLLAKHGQPKLSKMLDTLDSYKGSTGKVYKSDYHVLKEGGWVEDRVNKIDSKPILNGNLPLDRRTKTKENIPVNSPADGRF